MEEPVAEVKEEPVAEVKEEPVAEVEEPVEEENQAKEVQDLIDALNEAKKGLEKTTSRAGLSMAPPSVVMASSKEDAISQRQLLLQEGFDYKVMVKGKNYLLASESSIGEAEKKGYKVVSIDSFMGSKAMTMRRSKTNPLLNPGVPFAVSRQFQRWAERNLHIKIAKADIKLFEKHQSGDEYAIDSHINFPSGTEGYDMFMYALPNALGATSLVKSRQVKEDIELLLERLYNRGIMVDHIPVPSKESIFLTLQAVGTTLYGRPGGPTIRSKSNPRGLSRTLAKAAAETRASKLNKTIYCVKGEDKKWHIKESKPNSGEYFEVKPNPNDEAKLKCTYKKTKRSKPCGSEVSLMKNGRIYKCRDCGAKYEMR